MSDPGKESSKEGFYIAYKQGVSAGRAEERQAVMSYLNGLRETNPDPAVLRVIEEIEQEWRRE